MLIHGKRVFLLNTIAALAYLSVIVQWLVAVLPFVPGLVRSDIFKTYFSNQNDSTQYSPTSEMVTPEILTVIFTILAAVLAVGALFAGIVAIARIPASVGKSAAKVTHSAAKAVLPVIIHHKKMTVKKKRLLTVRIIFDIKLALLAVPLLLALVAPIEALQSISRDLYIFIAAAIAAWSLALFCLQIVSARVMRVDLSQIW